MYHLLVHKNKDMPNTKIYTTQQVKVPTQNHHTEKGATTMNKQQLLQNNSLLVRMVLRGRRGGGFKYLTKFCA